MGADANWQLVEAGGYHTCAVRTDGSLWCWGGNSNGQLGLGDTMNRP
ncbi:MAG: RCC1 domain-containing protein, partial [Myxococcota bacterium]|nr:RCC1 domain-containing protein [Myxococcota bacterium]